MALQGQGTRIWINNIVQGAFCMILRHKGGYVDNCYLHAANR